MGVLGLNQITYSKTRNTMAKIPFFIASLLAITFGQHGLFMALWTLGGIVFWFEPNSELRKIFRS